VLKTRGVELNQQMFLECWYLLYAAPKVDADQSSSIAVKFGSSTKSKKPSLPLHAIHWTNCQLKSKRCVRHIVRPEVPRWCIKIVARIYAFISLLI